MIASTVIGGGRTAVDVALEAVYRMGRKGEPADE
jgi:hypothetical protein